MSAYVCLTRDRQSPEGPGSLAGLPEPKIRKPRQFFPKKVIFPPFHVSNGTYSICRLHALVMLYFSFFVVCSLPFCSVLVGNFPRNQVVQWDYLNSTGSLTVPSLEVRSPRRPDYSICRALTALHPQVCSSYGTYRSIMTYSRARNRSEISARLQAPTYVSELTFLVGQVVNNFYFNTACSLPEISYNIF